MSLRPKRQRKSTLSVESDVDNPQTVSSCSRNPPEFSPESGPDLPTDQTVCGDEAPIQPCLDPDVLYARGKALLKNGELAEAEAIFRHCVRIHPHGQTPFKVQFQLGLALKRQLQLDAAARVLEQSLTSKCSRKKKTRLLLHKGSIYTLMGEHGLARSAFAQAQSLGRGPESLGCLAWHYLQVGFIKQAFNAISSCKINSFQHPELYVKLKYLLALCLYIRGQTTDAVTCLFQVLRDDPSSHLYWLSCGTFFAEAGQNGEAFDYFAQAHLRRPDAWEVWHNFGVLYEKQGFLDEAMAAYKAAAELNPEKAHHQLVQGKRTAQEFIQPELDIADFFMGKTTRRSRTGPESAHILQIPMLEKAVTTGELQSSSELLVKGVSEFSDDKGLPSSPLVGLPMPPVRSGGAVTVQFLIPLVKYFQRLAQSASSSSIQQSSLSSLDSPSNSER